MTDTVAEVADPITPSPTPAPVDDRRNRILLWIAAVAAVVPFFWAAVRDARNGFYPTMDVAATVLRARATFSANPPLLGMWSSGSSWAGHEIHFPGPILLYLLSVPVHLLGNTWGPLIGMAIINAFWVLLAGWLIHRLLGVNAALVGFGFLNLFIWSLGSENLIDPRPMEMVTIPYLCFLLLVWLVASGKIDALPGLALVANYLFLNHLVMAVQIPTVGLCAVAGAALWIRRVRRGDPAEVDRDGNVATLARLWRRLIQTALITFVMWLPSLIQQVTHSPGNLRLLLDASSQHRDPVGSYTVGYTVTIRLIAKPMFWLRGRFADPDFPQGLHRITVWDVLAGLVLVGGMVALAVVAWRRRDRLILGAMGVATVALAAGIFTVTQAPSMWGFPMQYLRSLWGTAAFVWFAIAFSIWRLVAPALRVHLASIAGVAAVVLGVLSLSFANYAAATDMTRSPFAREFVDRLVPKVRDRGPIDMIAGPNFESQRFYSAALLALDTEGIPYCVDRHASEQYGAEHDCYSEDHMAVLVQAPDAPGDEDLTSLVQVRLLTPEEKRELSRTRSVFRTWIASDPTIELTDTAQQMVDALGPEYAAQVDETIHPSDGDLRGLMSSDTFRLIIGYEENHRADPENQPRILADASTPVADISLYFQLMDPRVHGSVWAFEVRPGVS